YRRQAEGDRTRSKRGGQVRYNNCGECLMALAISFNASFRFPCAAVSPCVWFPRILPVPFRSSIHTFVLTHRRVRSSSFHRAWRQGLRRLLSVGPVILRALAFSLFRQDERIWRVPVPD